MSFSWSSDILIIDTSQRKMQFFSRGSLLFYVILTKFSRFEELKQNQILAFFVPHHLNFCKDLSGHWIWWRSMMTLSIFPFFCVFLRWKLLPTFIFQSAVKFTFHRSVIRNELKAKWRQQSDLNPTQRFAGSVLHNALL